MPKTSKSFIMMKPWAMAKAVHLITSHGTFPNEDELDPRLGLPIFVYNKGWDDARVAEILTGIYEGRLNGNKFSRQHIYKIRREMVGPQRAQYTQRGTGYKATGRPRSQYQQAELAERRRAEAKAAQSTEIVPVAVTNGNANAGAELQHAKDLIQPLYNCMSQMIEQQRIIIANQQYILTCVDSSGGFDK